MNVSFVRGWRHPLFIGVLKYMSGLARPWALQIDLEVLVMFGLRKKGITFPLT